jgi:tape measure domain-containing protein
MVTLAQSYRQFVASTQGANLGLERQQQLFTIITATARIAGASTDQLQRFITGLSQALDRGVLQAEEFNQMQEAIPGVMNRVAAALNKNINDLRLGKVSMVEFIQGIEKGLGSDVPKAARIAETSISGMINRISNSWKEFLTAIGESSMVREALSDTVRLLHLIQDTLASMGAMAPRALTPIQKIREEIAQLQRDIPKLDLYNPEEKDEARLRRLAELTNQYIKLTQEDAKARKEAAEMAGPKAATESLLAAANAYNYAWEQAQRYFDRLKAAGMQELPRLQEEQQTINRLLQDYQDRLRGLGPGQEALEKLIMSEVAALAKEADARKAAIKAIQDAKEKSDQAERKKITDAEEAKQRDLDARVRLQAINIGLKENADAQRDNEDATRAMSLEKRNLYAEGLRSAEVLAAENAKIREQNALKELTLKGDKALGELQRTLNRERAKELGEITEEVADIFPEREGTPEQQAAQASREQDIIAQRNRNRLLQLTEEGDRNIAMLNRRLAALRGNTEEEREFAIAMLKGTDEQKQRFVQINKEIIAQKELNEWLKEWGDLYETQQRLIATYAKAVPGGRLQGTMVIPPRPQGGVEPEGPNQETQRTADYLEEVESRLLSIQQAQMSLDPVAFEKWKVSLMNLQPEQEATLKWLIALEDQSKKTMEIFESFATELQNFGEGIASTIESAMSDLLNNTDNALHDLGGWLENFGKSLIKLFGEEIIQLGLIPLKAAIKQFGEELAKSEAIKQIVKLVGNIVNMIFGGGGGLDLNMSAIGSGSSQAGFLGSAHGNIFGSPVALQRGGLVASPRLSLLGEATPEAVVPLTAEGIARFTRGLQRGAPGGGVTPAVASREHEQRRWQETVESLAKRPVVIEVTLNNPIDPRKMGLQPEEVVQVVGRNINEDGIIRRLVVKHAGAR